MNAKPRLRMFAGPNGSGKSTIKEVLPAELLGVYINPDEIEKQLANTRTLDLACYQVKAQDGDFITYLHESTLLEKAGLLDQVPSITCTNGVINFGPAKINSYFASVIASYIREKLLESKTSFTFETVMSSADKVEFLHKAQKSGFRTYLYFVATEDPRINISRVAYRVRTGGHPVPEEKIISRYSRSLDLLFQALRYSDRAYIFDNSGSNRIWLAEITDGAELEIREGPLTNWFNTYIWEKLHST